MLRHGVAGVGQHRILNRASLGERRQLVGRLRRDRDERRAGLPDVRERAL